MRAVRRVDTGTLLQITEVLEAIVTRCFGTGRGQVLFTRDSGEVVITRDGWRIISSLHLEHPVARVLVDCVSAHCKATGDGAKSFLLLLAALLRGIQATCRPHPPAVGGQQGRLAARRVAALLLSFQARVLDGVVERYVTPLCTPLLPPADPTNARLRLRMLTEAYFWGKMGDALCSPLSEIACDFYCRWRLDGDPQGVTALVSSHFEELHTAVTGLPVGRSQVLEGLVLHRDMAVHCPTDGLLKALVVMEPLQCPLAPTGTTLTLTSVAQIQGCLGWVAKQVEQVVSSLRQLQVGLLLSTVKQSDLLLDHARRAGMSVVECVTEEELSLFCQLTGVVPLAFFENWSLVGEQHVATVTFCRPVVLGSNRYTHLGLPEGRGFYPHCLVLCGPVPGLTDQCVSAFRGTARMLQRVCEPVQWHHWQGGEGANGDEPDCAVKRANPYSEAGSYSNRGILIETVNRTYEHGDEAPSHGTAFGCSPSEEAPASRTLIEPGSVLPVGGAFEFLLHHYLLQHASESTCPDTQEVCKLVANALLSVPRGLYSRRRFLEVHALFLSAVRTGPQSPIDPIGTSAQGLESLACKYQLLVSVLQCLKSLLCVDLILPTSTPCRRIRDRDREQEESET